MIRKSARHSGSLSGTKTQLSIRILPQSASGTWTLVIIQHTTTLLPIKHNFYWVSTWITCKCFSMVDAVVYKHQDCENEQPVWTTHHRITKVYILNSQTIILNRCRTIMMNWFQTMFLIRLFSVRKVFETNKVVPWEQRTNIETSSDLLLQKLKYLLFWGGR